MDFPTVSIREIEEASSERLDEQDYGVIGFDGGGTVRTYSAVESRMAGLSPDRVIGKHLFTNVAPCMNNYLVAQRFEDEAELDEIIEYVLTFRMRPTPVRMKLLKSAAIDRRFILIQRHS